VITLALLLCCSAAQAPPPVVLRATPPQPFIGQECRLTLELTTGQPPAMPLRLTVPWLRRPEVGFTWGLAPEAWRCQRSVPLAEGLPLELDGGPPVWAERIPGPGGPTYRLTWSLVAGEPDAIFQGKLTFPPVRLGEAVSNPVTIEIRKLPRPRQDLAPWNLGVGPFRVTAAVAPDRLQLGTETTLAVTVQGSAAALALVPPPDLTRQSAFADGPFLSESAPETWSADGTNRTFRFRLRPRQVTDQGVPPIRFSWFDPGRQDYVTQATASLPLAVLAPPPTPQASAVTEIPGLLAPTAALKRPPAWDPTDLGIWFLLLAPTLTALVLWWRGRGEEGPGLPASAHARGNCTGWTPPARSAT
jgi:hypothetical protein